MRLSLRSLQAMRMKIAADSMASVGGLENLKHWLGQRRGAWEDSAREFGLEPPHGVIILGVQGCGKSLCARAVALLLAGRYILSKTKQRVAEIKTAMVAFRRAFGSLQ